MERDEALRSACFARLRILRAQHGDELPYLGALDGKFPYGGRRVAFLNRQKGIHPALANSAGLLRSRCRRR